MEKRTYIQPKMNVEIMQNEALMRPASPGVSGGYEPGTTSGAPARMMNIPAVQANDSVKVF